MINSTALRLSFCAFRERETTGLRIHNQCFRSILLLDSGSRPAPLLLLALFSVLANGSETGLVHHQHHGVGWYVYRNASRSLNARREDPHQFTPVKMQSRQLGLSCPFDRSVFMGT